MLHTIESICQWRSPCSCQFRYNFPPNNTFHISCEAKNFPKVPELLRTVIC